MDHLEQLGIAENTLIIFASDNGGLSNHTRANTEEVEDAYATDWHNSPVFSGKGAAYEGGYRVPMIVAWSGGDEHPHLPIPADSMSAQPVYTCDLLPTILTIVGADNPLPEEHRDGIDLSSLLIGEVTDMDPRPGGLFWHYPHQWRGGPGATQQAGVRPFSAVRQHEWKLIYFYTPAGGEVELYNLADDLGERNNLAGSADCHGDLARLAGLMLDQFEAMGAQLPIDKATGQTVDISNLEQAAGR